MSAERCSAVTTVFHQLNERLFVCQVSNVAGNMAGKVGNVLGGFSKGIGGKFGGFF